MKIALVTGANSGFGLHTSLELLKMGFVVYAAMRDINKKDNLVDEAKKLNLLDNLHVHKVDVTKIDDIEKVKEKIHQEHGQLSVLINNAGYCQGGFLSDLSFEEWNNQFQTNVHGAFLVTKTMLSLLENEKDSKVINISSVSAIIGLPGMSAYSSSKFALEGLSESLRIELLSKNIYVSLVEPASYKTKIWEKGLGKISETTNERNSYQENVVTHARSAEKNGGNPIDVAKLILKICKTNKPKLRYQIGKGAKTLYIIKKLVPWCLIEKIIQTKLNRG